MRCTNLSQTRPPHNFDTIARPLEAKFQSKHPLHWWLSYSQRVRLNLLCPAPQKGPTTAPYYWCWMVMLFMYLYGEVTKKVGFVSADSWRVWKSTASLDSVDRTSVSQIQFSFPHENNTLIYVRLLRFFAQYHHTALSPSKENKPTTSTDTHFITNVKLIICIVFVSYFRTFKPKYILYIYIWSANIYRSVTAYFCQCS